MRGLASRSSTVLAFFSGVNELPRSENGQFSDRRGGEVPGVARNQGAFQRERAFRERGIVGIRKPSDNMGRRDNGERCLGLNPLEHDRHFVPWELELRTKQDILIFKDDPVI